MGVALRSPSAGGSKTPDQLSGLFMWWKADALGLTDGAAVATWTSSDSNAWSATAAGSNQPTFKAAPTGFNGKPAVLFDAVNNRLDIPFNSGLNPAGAMTVFAVVQLVSTTGSKRIFVSRNESGVGDGGYTHYAGNGNGFSTFGAWASDGEFFAAATSPSSGVSELATATTYVLAGTCDGTSNVKGYNDGTLEQSFNTVLTYSRNTVGAAYIGGDPNFGSGNLGFNGYIAEIVGYGSELSSTDRASIDTYLGNKYGVTVADAILPTPGAALVVPNRAIITRASAW